MSKRNLLICFDAFGTLFRPRRPIAQQYGEVARSLGLRGFTDAELEKSFRAAFKEESKRHPNYGKATGLGAERWWTNVIHSTFRELAPSTPGLLSEIASRLLHRFSSGEGYVLYPDVIPLLHRLRRHSKNSGGDLIVGVITTSDDRAPSILESIGVNVSPLRYGNAPTYHHHSGDYDIDFTVMSYDVGHEKPDRRIFEAGEEMLDRLILSSNMATQGLPSASDWHRVYVGDEYDKDIAGALAAGWLGVLIDREGPQKRSDICWLDEQMPGTLFEAFAKSRAVGFTSMAKLADWIPENRP